MSVVSGDPLAIIHSMPHSAGSASRRGSSCKLVFGVLYRATPGTIAQAYNFSDIGLVLVVTAIVIVAAIRKTHANRLRRSTASG